MTPTVIGSDRPRGEDWGSLLPKGLEWAQGGGMPAMPGLVVGESGQEELRRVRLAYADPPYPGQSAKHYAEHPDFDGEVDHLGLLRELQGYDGWVLHTASTTLADVLALAEAAGMTGFRVMAWVKPFAAFKRNVSVAYAWEPVLVKPVRKPVVSGRIVMRDWLAESITLRRGLTGAKPEKVCRWLFEVAGLEPDDELVDLFPGTGAVTRAWESWRDELRDAA